MSQILRMGKIMTKKYDELYLNAHFKNCMGQLFNPFKMCVWGGSGNGKTDFVFQFAGELCKYGTVLYVSLEMGHGPALQGLLQRHKDIDHKNILITDHRFSYADLITTLESKRSPDFIVIDSIDYLGISYKEYTQVVSLFSNKSWIFICHARGNHPASRTAEHVRYDADIKVHVKGFIAFITSRFGGNQNYLIWKRGAKRYWGEEKLKELINKNYY